MQVSASPVKYWNEGEFCNTGYDMLEYYWIGNCILFILESILKSSTFLIYTYAVTLNIVHYRMST
jgi:hypothetical protein